MPSQPNIYTQLRFHLYRTTSERVLTLTSGRRRRRREPQIAMSNPGFLLVAALLLASALSSGAARDFDAELRRAPHRPDPGFPGAGGFGIPGWGGGNGFPGGGGWGHMGGGWGAGYGGPSGGYSKGGIVRPSVVCREKGPCYKKKLTCPAKCFTSYSHSGRNGGGGGGGGGCSFDCSKRCVAYC